MNGKRVQTPYDELTYKIIGCAMAVHRQLGPGRREDTYQRDLEVRFTASGLAYAAQKLIEVADSALFFRHQPFTVRNGTLACRLASSMWIMEFS